jgi:hypothetical protein
MRGKLKLLAILFLSFGIRAHAQEAITAAGGNASGTGGVSCYSIGQIIYTTNSGTNGSVSQGVQQSFDVIVITALERAKGIDLRCLVYPNPATDHLILQIDGLNFKNLMYKLYDSNGKLLAEQEPTGNETIIPMNRLVSAIYILKVIENNQEIKSFKIIKK